MLSGIATRSKFEPKIYRTINYDIRFHFRFRIPGYYIHRVGIRILNKSANFRTVSG